MAFATPEGTQFIRLLGGGSVFQVGLVRLRDRELVCKRLSPHALETLEGRAAMVREAKLLSMVKHHALPQLVHLGNDAQGPFFLETFVAGTPLRELAQAWKERDKPIAPTLLRHIALEAFQTLAEVHALADAQGPLDVVHGDISPDHVLFGPLGDVRFVDLGAARFRGLEPDVDTDDHGTVPYAPPEVVRGDAKPGQTTDIYALSATLLWFAAGEELCEASTDAARLAEVAQGGIRRELIDRLTAFTTNERAWFHAALDPDPTRRCASMKLVIDLLRASSDCEPVSTKLGHDS